MLSLFITVVVVSKKPITFGSILLAEKVVMNENVNFNSFQFQKNKVAHQKIAIFASFQRLDAYSLSVSLAWWNLVFSSKPQKMFNLDLEAKIFKIIQNSINMNPSSDCFLCSCQIWTWYDHWESLKIGSVPLCRSYCMVPMGNWFQVVKWFHNLSQMTINVTGSEMQIDIRKSTIINLAAMSCLPFPWFIVRSVSSAELENVHISLNRSNIPAAVWREKKVYKLTLTDFSQTF